MKKMGLMFPGITHVTIERKSDGEKVKGISKADLEEKLSEKDFDKVRNEVFLWGEYEDARYKITIHKQVDKYDPDQVF